VTRSEAPKGHDHPMGSLARGLGGGLRYPPPVSDARLRVLLAIAPCAVLIMLSISWAEGAPFLLTFAGAFASIQLAQPYSRWVRVIGAHLEQARAEGRGALSLALIKLEFAHQPSLLVDLEPVGYSPAGRFWARRRYARLARRWNRSFLDINGRHSNPDGSCETAAAFLRYDHTQRQDIDLKSFISNGQTPAGRFARLSLAIPIMMAETVARRLSRMAVVERWKKNEAERVLRSVATELIRAYAIKGADAPVVRLAEQIGVDYRRPELKPGWVTE
jgi:hypothetical protein